MDDCEHGLPRFLCVRCKVDGNSSAVASGFIGQVNSDSDEPINVAEYWISDTIAAVEEPHDPLEGSVEKTAENITSAKHASTVLPYRAHGSR